MIYIGNSNVFFAFYIDKFKNIYSLLSYKNIVAFYRCDKNTVT